MGKTSDLMVVQKTITDTLHMEKRTKKKRHTTMLPAADSFLETMILSSGWTWHPATEPKTKKLTTPDVIIIE